MHTIVKTNYGFYIDGLCAAMQPEEAAMVAKLLTAAAGTDNSVVAIVRITEFEDEYMLADIEHIIPPFNNFHILRFDTLSDLLIGFIQTSWTCSYQSELFFTFAHRDRDNNIKQGPFQSFRQKTNSSIFSKIFSSAKTSEDFLHINFTTSVERSPEGASLIFHTQNPNVLIPILENLIKTSEETQSVT